MSAASVANKLYVVGGYDGQARLSLVEKLDFTQQKLQWEPVTSMHQRRGLAGICVYKGDESKVIAPKRFIADLLIISFLYILP